MARREFLRTEDGERVDAPDFKHGTVDSQIRLVEPIGASFLQGEDRTRVFGEADQPTAFVLKGFRVTWDATASVHVLERGSAMLAFNDAGTIRTGMVVNLTENIPFDVSGVSSPGTIHGVYVCLKLTTDQNENRQFWDPFAGTPVEETRMIPTRFVEMVDIRVSPTSPGAEWMRVALLTPSVPATITLARNFFFEGQEDLSFVLSNSDWGYANDRSSDRATNGVFGLRRFAMGVLRQLQDITGTAWYTTPPISLLETKTNRLDRRGSGAVVAAEGQLSGDLTGDTSDTRSLGTYALRFLQGVFNRLDISAHNLAAANLPRITIASPDGVVSTADYTHIFDFPRFGSFPWSGTALTAYRARLYRGVSSGSFVFTFNAAWDPGSVPQTWVPDDGAVQSFKYTIGFDEMLGETHDATGGVWQDISGVGNWDRREFFFTLSATSSGAIYGTTQSWRRLLLDRTLVRLSELQFDSASTRHGTAASVTGGTYLATLSSANQPGAGAFVHDLSPVAWAHITWTGSTDTLAVEDSVGFASFQRTGNDTIEAILNFDLRNNAGVASSSSGCMVVTPGQSTTGAISNLAYALQTDVRTFSIFGTTNFTAGTSQRYFIVVYGRAL